ncbi:shikimate dehydrogenase [Paraglaciecola aestuariivivens]
MKKFTVFGNPIAQSKSPIIHQMFAQQLGLNIEYERTLATPEHFTRQLSAFFAEQNATGCNVTAPFKEVAATWVNSLSASADFAGAVNTIIKTPDGKFKGDTTDGAGLVQDLHRLGVKLKGANILMLGAGGAARSVLQPLLSEQPNLLVLANRTEQKAKQLADLINSDAFIGVGFDKLESMQQNFDLIINSTSASLTGHLPNVTNTVYEGCAVAYDMSYADSLTIFLQHCKKLGVTKTYDGLGMLVGQAAESFYLWTGQRPSVEPVIEALSHQL